MTRISPSPRPALPPAGRKSKPADERQPVAGKVAIRTASTREMQRYGGQAIMELQLRRIEMWEQILEVERQIKKQRSLLNVAPTQRRPEIQAEIGALNAQLAALKAADEHQRTIERAVYASFPAEVCGACGWNGKVDPHAHGQRCPQCGAAL